MVYRLCQTGEWQMTRLPDMSRVRWGEASAYVCAAREFPQLREFYLQIACQEKRNKRLYDMAVKDYYCNRDNRMGPELFFWNAESRREKIRLCWKSNNRKQR